MAKSQFSSTYYISTNIGESLLGIGARSLSNTPPGTTFNVIPCLTLNAEKSLDSVFSIGISYNNQTMIFDYQIGNIGERLMLLNHNIGLRSTLQLFKKSKDFQSYIGTRIGYSYFLTWSTFPTQMIPQETFSIFNGYSFQFISGFRFFMFKNAGLNIEFCLGRPYFISAGLTFRINTNNRRNKQIQPAKISDNKYF